jgi:DNA-binding NtrC family response regulator
MITANRSVETAVRALKSGAYDYLLKPLDEERLTRAVERALEQSRSRREVEQLRDNLREVSPKTDLVGRSAAMKRVREQVETVAPTEAPVLITGESGTGKEIVARAIHEGSPRRQRPLAVVRCGALTEELLEGELFGFDRPLTEGAPRKKGKFEIADGGSAFLDEISEVGLKTQTDLLNVAEAREMVRVGGSKPIKIDFRWVAASNIDLMSRVREGRFRSELYYRLNVFSIDLPPLRDRREDIPGLVTHFLEKHARQMNRGVPPVSKKAMDLLLLYRWPGNVRELENAVERALLISRDEEIQPAHFPFQLDLSDENSGQSLQEMERRHIRKVVEQSGWNLSKSARILGIDRTTLYNKIKRYRLR